MKVYEVLKGGMYVIDGAKLNDLLKNTGKNKSDLSRDFGFNSCYFSQACQRNRIKKPAIKWLETTYGIKLDDYAVFVEKPMEELIKDVPAEDLSTNDFLETISELREEINKISAKIDNLPFAISMYLDAKNAKK